MLRMAHEKLGWPSPADVVKPHGAGPEAYARLVRAKFGRILANHAVDGDVTFGILAADPMADATEPPIAIICEFQSRASQQAIAAAHWLAWNFCRAPLLITL